MHVSLCGFSTLFLIQVFHCKLQKCYYCVLGFLAVICFKKKIMKHLSKPNPFGMHSDTLHVFFCLLMLLRHICTFSQGRCSVCLYVNNVLLIQLFISACLQKLDKKVFRSVHYQNVPNVHLVINSIGYQCIQFHLEQVYKNYSYLGVELFFKLSLSWFFFIFINFQYSASLYIAQQCNNVPLSFYNVSHRLN